ncbi:histidine kinase [Candidatus Aquiluna sp. IMCC13023]|uniref:sensor histidine kinase n=1 Tax=Candidatus Aquiluna sp. IMCC13023 TaxID=1081644 RepID=UPI00025B37FA|nr:ATP-binding protein [Candidatus Aquiluna sp. IMCC13023]EIC91203.1 histidine kinase [Candidatus Aquiluna sp. IMCC13023]
MQALKNTFRAIGGPWLLDRLQSVLVGIPVVLIVSLAWSGAATWDQYLVTLLSNILIFGLVLLTSELARRTIFASIRERPANPFLVLAFGAGLGAVVYLLEWFLESSLADLAALPSLGRLAVFTAAGAILIPAASLLERLRRRSRVRRRINLERVTAPIDQAKLSANLALVFDDLSANVSAKFRQLRRDVGLTSRDSLERVIMDCIKPLSKSLAHLSGPTARYFLIRGTTAEALALRPFGTPIPAAFVYAAGFWLVNVVFGRGGSAVIPALSSFFLLTITIFFAQLAWSKFALGRGLLAILVFASIMSIPITSVNQFYLSGSIQLEGVVAGLLLNFVVVSSLLVTAALISFRPELQVGEYKNVLQNGKNGSLNQAFSAMIYRRLSQKLHGAVQSDVLALQLSIDAAQTIDSVELEDEVITIIEKARDEFLADAERPLSNRVTALIDQWAFLAEVVVTNSCQDLSPLQESICFMLIQEAVTNSVRHGSATSIEVKLSSEKSGVFNLSVVDNGTGPLAKSSKLGSGLSVLRALTEDEFSLSFNEGGGAKLTATIYS